MRDGIIYDHDLDRFRLNLDALAGCVANGELLISGSVVRTLAGLTEATPVAWPPHASQSPAQPPRTGKSRDAGRQAPRSTTP